MTRCALAGAVVFWLVMSARPAFSHGDLPSSAGETPAAMADDATLLRVFLKDGTSLVSYGELARVGERVVFSMPTSASPADPRLHLVNLAADHVDWDRTDRYADSARTARYLATRADSDYAMLTSEIAQVLNDVSLTADPLERLAIVQKARKALADWPPRHFNHKQAEVSDMLGMLDEAIAELRVAAGLDRFDLSFVAAIEPRAVAEPLLPPPTPKEVIEQTLTAARLADSPADRISLLAMALTALRHDVAGLPRKWVASMTAAARGGIAREVETDRQYRSLTEKTLRQATVRARAADIRGLERLLAQIQERDRSLGVKRPDAVNALTLSVQAHLDAARQLQLGRDRWALRIPDFRLYDEAVTAPLKRLSGLKSSLEEIKALAGSAPATLASIQGAAGQALKMLHAIVPPDEFRAIHALFVSAARLADGAARLRRDAALSGDMARAWDASSAAAGALMLDARARSEMQALFRLPQLGR